MLVTLLRRTLLVVALDCCSWPSRTRTNADLHHIVAQRIVQALVRLARKDERSSVRERLRLGHA